MSYIAGGGFILNSMARQNVQYGQGGGQAMRMNMMGMQNLRLSLAQVQELVHEVATVPTSAEQLQQVIDQLVAIREEANQERADRALQDTPYSGLARILPKDRNERLIWFQVFLMVLQMILPYIAPVESPPQTTVVEVHIDEQQIVQQIEKVLDEKLPDEQPAEPVEGP